MSETTHTSASGLWGSSDDGQSPSGWALVVAWSLAEPHRLGELAWMPERGNPRVLGRGEGGGDEAEERLFFQQQRPGRNTPTGALRGGGLSRRQAVLIPTAGSLRVGNLGRCELLVNGRSAGGGEVRLQVGDTLLFKNQLLLLVEKRPSLLPRTRTLDMDRAVRFGAADALGMVGESPASWALRDELAFCARRDAHVLVTGPSGVGKELAARALHGLSARGDRVMVARNAATLPEGLIDAELFGNLRNYPNPGMAERRGLIGEAHGSTLFLDEIGELGEALQAHLLRVLDQGGEYQRLGESRPRTSDLRLVAATNRDVAALKHDLAARLTLHVALPGLDQRRADIPLLVRHLLSHIATSDPEVGARFFEAWGRPEAHPRVAPELMERLVRHAYSLHVRELHQLLWKAMSSSTGKAIDLTPEVLDRLGQEAVDVDPASLTRAAIEAALQRNGQNKTQAAADLGLRNRDVLYRRMKKLGMS